MKLEKSAGTLLAPVPVVMVSCAAPGFRSNIITIAWVGTICSDPPMLGISIRPERYSYALIRESREFVVNVPNRALLRMADFCGVVSGRECDKFHETGLTPANAKMVKAPLIMETPVNIECRVSRIVPLGSHELFLAEILLIHLNGDILGPGDMPDLLKMQAVCYGNGSYYQTGEYLGRYGFSGRKPR